ncbi:MAG: hypothetical protein ACLFNK_04395 [Candidatus Woesearchaeota archaeon]
MKIPATIFRVHLSNELTLFIIFPSFETLLTKMNEKIITGSPVANAKTEGIINPSPARSLRFL